MNNNKTAVEDLRLISVLVLATLCCLGLAQYLRVQSDKNMFNFLSWDVFLAWVPFILSTIIRYISSKKITKLSLIGIGLLSVVWLFFLPNSAYLFTEIIHSFRYLDAQGEARFWFQMDFWYSLTVTFGVAIIGLFLSICSIHQVHRLLNRMMSRVSSMLIIAVIILLSSLGVYIGRFNRWNSWDLLSQPEQILRDLMTDISSGRGILIEFVAILFTIQVFGYVIIGLLTARSSKQEERSNNH